MPDRQLREVFRLGGVDAPEEEVLQREPPLTVDRNGNLYVLHRDLGLVAVFDETGDFVRWIRGGRGEGPGEFTSASQLGFVGDTLWVRNFTPPRISRFLVDGTHVSSEPVLVVTEYRTTAGVQGISGYLQRDRAWLEPDGFVMQAEGSEPRAPFMVGDREMNGRLSIFDWRAGRGRLAGTSFDPIPEPPFYDVAPDGSGILLAEWSSSSPAELRLRFFSPDGGEARVSTLLIPPVPIPPSVLDSLVAAGQQQVSEVRERVIAAGVPPEQAPSVPTTAEVRMAAFLPDFRPPIRGVLAGLDGTIWLHRSDGESSEVWVALDMHGTALFRLRLPEGTHLRQASQQAIWTTAIGELDVPYVIRWDLE